MDKTLEEHCFLYLSIHEALQGVAIYLQININTHLLKAILQ